MIKGGIKGVLITTPVIGAEKINRLMALYGHAKDLLIVVDNLRNICEIAKAAEVAGKIVNSLVAIDIGTQRIGIFN